MSGSLTCEASAEGVGPVDGHRRAIDHDVLPVVGEVGFGEGEAGGEDGGGGGRGE